MSKRYALGYIHYPDFVTEEDRERDRQFKELSDRLEKAKYALMKSPLNRSWDWPCVIYFCVLISVTTVPQLWVKLFCWLSTIGVG